MPAGIPSSDSVSNRAELQLYQGLQPSFLSGETPREALRLQRS